LDHQSLRIWSDKYKDSRRRGRIIKIIIKKKIKKKNNNNNKKRCKNKKSPNFVWGLNKKTAIYNIYKMRERVTFFQP
jgi:hypothetical protein